MTFLREAHRIQAQPKTKAVALARFATTVQTAGPRLITTSGTTIRVREIPTRMTGIGHERRRADRRAPLSLGSKDVSIAGGFDPSSNVPEALERLGADLPDSAIVACRSIDSIRSGSEIVSMLRRWNVEAELVNDNACITVRALRALIASGRLTGFDEVWVFSRGPPLKSLAAAPPATTDSENFDVELPTELQAAMQEHGCLLVLGDGDGLNWAASDGVLTTRLRDAYQADGP